MPVLRPVIFAAVAAALLVPAPKIAIAQGTPAQRAEALNERGKQLFTESKDYAAAAAKFREAIVLDPQPKYYVNLCFALHLVGNNREALSNCAIAEKNGDGEVVEKAQKLSSVIRERMAESGQSAGTGQTDPGGSPGGEPPSGDPNNGASTGNELNGGMTGPGPGGPTGPGNGQPGTGGTTPGYYSPFINAPTKPGDYMWSVGAELGLFRNLGLGNDDAYAPEGGSLRAYANFMFGGTFGGQAYLDYATLQGNGGDNDPLQIFDVGAGVFTHYKLGGNFYLTPLVGAHIAMLQPDPENSTALVTLGGRAELGIDWLLGTRGEHVIHIKPVAFNVYAGAQSSDPDLMSPDYGLDEPGGAYTLTVGYSYRFATPFGSSPLITLE